MSAGCPQLRVQLSSNLHLFTYIFFFFYQNASSTSLMTPLYTTKVEVARCCHAAESLKSSGSVYNTTCNNWGSFERIKKQTLAYRYLLRWFCEFGKYVPVYTETQRHYHSLEVLSGRLADFSFWSWGKYFLCSCLTLSPLYSSLCLPAVMCETGSVKLMFCIQPVGLCCMSPSSLSIIIFGCHCHNNSPKITCSWILLCLDTRAHKEDLQCIFQKNWLFILHNFC